MGIIYRVAIGRLTAVFHIVYVVSQGNSYKQKVCNFQEIIIYRIKPFFFLLYLYEWQINPTWFLMKNH